MAANLAEVVLQGPQDNGAGCYLRVRYDLLRYGREDCIRYWTIACTGSRNQKQTHLPVVAGGSTTLVELGVDV